MSRALSNIPGSDSPLRAILLSKGPHSNVKLTRQENHRELRHDMMHVSYIVEPDRFLELFVPEPNALPGKTARQKPSNPFTNIAKPTSEKKMYEDYPKLLNKITRGSSFAFAATPYKADNATESQFAVDCGMYPRKSLPMKEQTKGMSPEAKKDFRRVCWSGIDIPAECKVTEDPFEDSVDVGQPFGDKRKAACGQALSYIELTYHHQHRTFVFMLVFIGIHCRLLRVDRSGLFVTKRFNITNTDYLIEFLWRYIQLSPTARGHDTTAERIESQATRGLAKLMKDRLSEVEKAWEDAENGEEDEDEDREEKHVVDLWKKALDPKWPWWKLCIPDDVTHTERWFLVGRPSFQAPGVRGRGTRCYIAVEAFKHGKNKWELDNKFVHLKDCWRVLGDGTDEMMDIRREGDTLKKLNSKKVPHIPTLIAHGDMKDQDTSTSPNAWKMINDKHKCCLKTHQHYRLVVEEIGKPLSEFENSGELLLALYDCIRAHRDAMAIHVIHRDISGGNILLYRKKGDETWHGLLTDWELSKDTKMFPKPRQHGRTGTLQFSAVRVLDDPGKPIGVADELECFFHVLIYYAVRFLKHNLPDKNVGLFLKNYFDTSSGFTLKGELTAPELKRSSMTRGRISLQSCGVKGKLRFMWVSDTPQVEVALGKARPTDPANSEAPAPDYNHPLNEVIETLLSWFSALYAVDELEEPAPTPSPASGSSQPRRGGKVIPLGRGPRNTARTSAGTEAKTPSLSPEKEAELRALAKKLDDQSNVLELIEDIAVQPFPMDKGKDRRPECGYTPRSPETPQFEEISSSDSGRDAEDDDQVDNGAAAVPDGPVLNDFAPLAAGDGDERGCDEHPAAEVVPAARDDELEYHDDNSCPPSPCPIRPKRASTRLKRGREDDAGREEDTGGEEDAGREDRTAPRASGKRSRY